jgi:hypothetical protein
MKYFTEEELRLANKQMIKSLGKGWAPIPKKGRAYGSNRHLPAVRRDGVGIVQTDENEFTAHTEVISGPALTLTLDVYGYGTSARGALRHLMARYAEKIKESKRALIDNIKKIKDYRYNISRDENKRRKVISWLKNK